MLPLISSWCGMKVLRWREELGKVLFQGNIFHCVTAFAWWAADHCISSMQVLSARMCMWVYPNKHTCAYNHTYSSHYTLNLSSCLSSKNCQQPLADSTRHLQRLRHRYCFPPFSLALSLSLSISFALCCSNRPTQLLFQKADEIVPWSTAGPLDLTLKSEPAAEMFAYLL